MRLLRACLLDRGRTRESWRVPDITGQVVILTVSSVIRSASWYACLLGMEERGRYAGPDGQVRQVSLVEPRTGLELCLVSHAPGTGSFDEFRAGLDHLEFLVAGRGDLDSWGARLDELGIAHSGVKEPPYTPNAMITFRDPDNIQLEFFWRAPEP
jgi:catechol 2,3-dioxygenase-like lactoylglutathione lyase family enzyme